jgi:hypothetical protein
MKDIKDNDIMNTSVQNDGPIALDDSKRVKVMSPGMLVFKRFIRNKLAIVGSIILIFMFCFTFLGVVVSPYGEREVFHKYDSIITDYAYAEYRTGFNNISVSNTEVPSEVTSMLNTYIASFSEWQTEMNFFDSATENQYNLVKVGTYCFVLNRIPLLSVAAFNTRLLTFAYSDPSYETAEFDGGTEGKGSQYP